jgi:hypothetical protein
MEFANGDGNGIFIRSEQKKARTRISLTHGTGFKLESTLHEHECAALLAPHSCSEKVPADKNACK